MRNLELGQRLVIYTVDTEYGPSPQGASISWEDLAELIKGEVVIQAHNQVGDLIEASFDMDGESLIVDVIKTNPWRDTSVLMSRSLLKNILYSVYKENSFANSEAAKSASWYLDWLIDSHYKNLQEHGYTLIDKNCACSGSTMKVLANGGVRAI